LKNSHTYVVLIAEVVSLHLQTNAYVSVEIQSVIIYRALQFACLYRDHFIGFDVLTEAGMEMAAFARKLTAKSSTELPAHFARPHGATARNTATFTTHCHQALLYQRNAVRWAYVEPLGHRQTATRAVRAVTWDVATR
jgi:hypothetical protein